MLRLLTSFCPIYSFMISTYKFLGGGGEDSYLDSGRAAAGSREILQLKNETWSVVGQTNFGRSLHAVSVIRYDDIQTSCDVPAWKDDQGKWKKNKDYIKF